MSPTISATPIRFSFSLSHKLTKKGRIMSNGSFQLYQHYLPATYIRQFKSNDFKGKNTVSGFVKIDASKDQVRKRIVPLNATNICGEPLRHTVEIDGQKDNMIEDCFNGLEKTYPDFVKIISEFHHLKARLYSYRGLHYFIKQNNLFNTIKKQKHEKIISFTRIYEIDDYNLRNLVFFISRFLCYRLESMDSFYESHQKPKLKEGSKLIKEILRENTSNFSSMGSIISRDDWRTILLLFKDSSKFLSESSAEKKKEMINVYKKIHRYLALPFLSLGSESKIKIYIHKALKDESIISCDNPFLFLNNDKIFSNGCIFTISPRFALIFTNQPLHISYKDKNSEPETSFFSISDMISAGNVANAKKYIFSNENKKLDTFTKHITPQFKEPVIKT